LKARPKEKVADREPIGGLSHLSDEKLNKVRNKKKLGKRDSCL